MIFVSDGSTDGTTEAVRAALDDRTDASSRSPTRGGKAGALNAGLAHARHDIVVFTDASILLEPGAVRAIVRPFADPKVGCVSGEDRIAGSGGEALYGRYELFIRRQEARLHSIVGASGSFYAQRRAICRAVHPQRRAGFLVRAARPSRSGYRALAEPEASGHMAAVERAAEEFERKVRTLLRGMTTLGRDAHLLNPFRYGAFAWCLFSHKVVRWLVPVFLLVCLLSSAAARPRLVALCRAVRPPGALLPAGAGGAAPACRGWRRRCRHESRSTSRPPTRRRSWRGSST